MPGKIIKFENVEFLAALEQLAKDKSGTFQEITDEAFADLLKKYNRPTTLLGALKESVKHPEDDRGRKQATGDKAGKGAVRKRTQIKGKLQGKPAWTKPSKRSGEFMDVKKSKKKIKGVRKEKKAA